MMALFESALALPAAKRAELLNRECGADRALLEEVQSLIDAHESPSHTLDELEDTVLSPALRTVFQTVHQARGEALRTELEVGLAGKYRILEELGGGMSRVFLAEEIRLARRVVIKVLPPELAGSASADRFRREIALAAQLQHPHIVPLLTSDSAGSLLYYTMPFVAGESLRARLTVAGTLPVRDAVAVWRDMLEALAHAHASGVVHGDVKPENVLLSGRNALISDLGVARALETAGGDAADSAQGPPIGTPAYMAPEQLVATADVDHRADLFAAGLVMYEMLEGRLPFAGDSARDVALARLTSDPAPVRRPDCPPALARLVAKCLERSQDARPPTASAVLAELETIDSTPLGRGRGARRRRQLTAYGVAAASIAAAVFAWRALNPDRAHSAAARAASAPAIAVLPLASLGRDAGDAALADGMTEELTARLGRSGRIRVAGRTSVRELQERRLNVRQIAESLNVSHVLEGALQRIGSRMRWQLRLVDASDGSTRWSETYDREIGDIFAMQDDIARAVASELNVRLLPAERGADRRRYTPDLAAYEWYLRGSSTDLLRSAAGLKQAIEYINKAIAADSNFAAAHARLVWIYNNMAGSAPGDHQEWFERAERSALRAVQLDDSLAEAYSALGWTRVRKRDWAGAEDAFKRAIALDPSVHRGFEGLARLYMLTGRPAEQLSVARRSLQVDPYSHAAMREMALAFNTNGRCDETLQLLRPLKSLDPPVGVAGVITGLCYLQKRMWPEAIGEFHWSMETTEARMALALLGYALARDGQTDEARRILDDLVTGRRHSHGAFGIAVVHAGLGDYDQAFAWLERAVEEHSWRVYIMDPVFEELHRDPRFARLGAFGRGVVADR
jgi:serine/threonine-protein kinase